MAINKNIDRAGILSDIRKDMEQIRQMCNVAIADLGAISGDKEVQEYTEALTKIKTIIIHLAWA